jgi:CopG family nickel-responsive transcriptional regulator
MSLTLVICNVTFCSKGNTMKSKLCRFSISMADDLVVQLEGLIKEKGYANRSQAVSELVRDRIVKHQAEQPGQEIAGTITLVYDHHRPLVQALLTDIQHDHGDVIISSMHVHLDHHNCMEILAVRGKSEQVQAMADQIVSAKGVKHGKLTVTTTGKDFKK